MCACECSSIIGIYSISDAYETSPAELKQSEKSV